MKELIDENLERRFGAVGWAILSYELSNILGEDPLDTLLNSPEKLYRVLLQFFHSKKYAVRIFFSSAFANLSIIDELLEAIERGEVKKVNALMETLKRLCC